MTHQPPITASAYLAGCKRRFGVANPERIVSPVWEWMIRERHNPYCARQALCIESNHGACGLASDPDWCFDRLGVAVVKLADGRRISIAGEHEDFYDPDFCIYNDVIVEHGDRIEMFGYRHAPHALITAKRLAQVDPMNRKRLV